MLYRKQTFGNFGSDTKNRVVATVVEPTMGGEKKTVVEPKIGEFIDVSVEVAYWRKANQIYRWLKEKCMDEDDDDTRFEVDIKDLRELLEDCEKVKKSITFVSDKVEAGRSWATLPTDNKVFTISLVVDKDNRVVDIVKTGESTIHKLKVGDLYVVEGEKNGWHELKEIEKRDSKYSVRSQLWELGKVIADPTVAKELLPTESGFFFGSTDYTEWYAEQIGDTITMLTEIIADYDKQIEDGVSGWAIAFELVASY